MKQELFKLNKSEATNIGRHTITHGVNGHFTGNYSPLLAAEQLEFVRGKNDLHGIGPVLSELLSFDYRYSEIYNFKDLNDIARGVNEAA